MTALMVTKAMHLATWAHEKQKYNGQPYIYHCRAVAHLAEKLALNWGMDPDVAMAVGWLHDAVEDSKLTLAKIALEVSPEVARVVGLLTRAPEEDYHDAYLPRLGPDRMARLVKLADMRCNLENLPSPGMKRTARDNRLWNKYIRGLEVLARYMGVPNVSA